jgi:hypothetical protein
MPFRGRIAYPSYVDESLFGNPHEKAVQMARSMPSSMKDAVLVTGTELRGMANRSKLGAPAPSAKQLDRERLHTLSNARKGQWPNTIEALREKKDRMRQEKLDAEEKLRVEIDREEEALQAEKRRLAIERANKMLYDSTDRVKALHSKLMLADVMEERERQIELKQRQRLREVEAEERYYQKQQDAIRRMDAEEDLRDEEEMTKRGEVGRVRSEQIESQKYAQSMKLAELKREGEMMKQMAIADAEAEQRQRLEEMEREQRNRAEVVEANAYLLKKRAEDQELQDAEEHRMLEYATQKEKDLLERRDREEQRFRERQAWRQQLIDRQIAKLTDLNASSNTRLANQAAEVQAKAQAARAKLDEQRKNELLVMHFSRQQQMRWKAERKAQETCDDEHYAGELKKLNVQLREEEAMAIRDRFEKAKGRDAFLLKQMAEKAAGKEEEKLEDMFEAEATKQWSQDDDAIFDQYAQMCLDEYVAAGKDPKPIELVMKKIKHRAD